MSRVGLVEPAGLGKFGNGFGAAGASEQYVYAVDSDGRGAVSLKHGKQRFDGKSVGPGDNVPAVLGSAGLAFYDNFRRAPQISIVRGCLSPAPLSAA